MKFSNYDKFKETKILRSSEMMRYANRSKIKQESVATHSFFVAANCYTIYNLYPEIKEKDFQSAVMYAVIHDIGEVGTSDLPYNFKYSVPGLKELLDKGEEKFIKEEFNEFHRTFLQFQDAEEKQLIPYLIVKMADIGSVIQYSQNEINLGNTSNDMQEILDGAIDRFVQFEQKLKNALEEQ